MPARHSLVRASLKAGSGSRFDAVYPLIRSARLRAIGAGLGLSVPLNAERLAAQDRWQTSKFFKFPWNSSDKRKRHPMPPSVGMSQFTARPSETDGEIGQRDEERDAQDRDWRTKPCGRADIS